MKLNMKIFLPTFFLMMGMIPLPNSELMNPKEPTGGVAACGPFELFEWVPESIVGPGWVMCDVIYEFDTADYNRNAYHARKLMDFRRKPASISPELLVLFGFGGTYGRKSEDGQRNETSMGH
jgi:hypothetical protein